jgi:hypothetical protein
VRAVRKHECEDMIDREVIILRLIAQAVEDVAYQPMYRDELIKHVCELGHRRNIHPDEVADVLVKSVQCVALPQSEWS